MKTLEQLVNQQKQFFLKGETKEISYRIKQLKKTASTNN